MAALEVIALDTVTPQLRAPGAGDTYTFPRAVAMSVPLPVSSGGTGQSTANAALNALLPSQSGQSGKFLTTDGTDTSWATAGGGSATLTIQNKTAAYTVVAGDLGTIINCTSGTFTVALDAAATLGSGFNCWIWNTSSTNTDEITINPSGAETIDGLPTLILRRGEGMQIVCDGTNWQTGDKKTMRGYVENISSGGARPTASGSSSIAIFEGSIANATRSLAVGYYAQATSTNSTAVGYGAIASASGANAFGYNANASSSNSLALGAGSSGTAAVTITGFGAMALGCSRASGSDSFAAAVANNTSSYGATGANSVAVGKQAKATQTSAVALGEQAQATGINAVSIGALSQSTGTASAAYGYNAKATASNALALGRNVTASGEYSVAIGTASSSAQYGKFAFAAWASFAQTGKLIVLCDTADATPKVLTSNTGAPGTTNQVILPNNSAYAFTGTVVARQQASGGTASAAWKIEGLIRREGSAGTTTLVASTVTAIDNTPGWTLALSADTTNGGLAITATGAAATNIRWVATVQTSEVTYA